MGLRGILLNRRLGWLGVCGPVIALLSIWLCIALSPWFTWQNHAISHLGISPVAWIFNASLVICGIMCAGFAMGMILRLRMTVGKLGMGIMFLACICLAGIGLFPMDMRPYHFLFSVAFFALLLMATLVLGPFFLLRRGTAHLGMGAVAVTALGIFGWAYHAAVGWGHDVAIPEALTFVPGGLWFMTLGLWVLRKDSGR